MMQDPVMNVLRIPNLTMAMATKRAAIPTKRFRMVKPRPRVLRFMTMS
jgi:hypothetical protein